MYDKKYNKRNEYHYQVCSLIYVGQLEMTLCKKEIMSSLQRNSDRVVNGTMPNHQEPFLNLHLTVKLELHYDEDNR